MTGGYNEAAEPDKPTPDQIVEALRSAGWLLEQETDATLRAAGYHTVMGYAFPDPDDPAVSREIDVTGYRQLYQSDDLGMSVGVRIIAECKQSSMPYVLIGRKGTSSNGRPRIEQHLRFDTVEIGRTPLGSNSYRPQYVDAGEYIGIRNLPGNPWNTEFVATQMTKLERRKTWLADNKGIFTSLVYPLAKAVTYFRSQNRRDSYVDHKPGRDWANIMFYYPIVVTSAQIHVLDVGDDPLVPKQLPWTTMTRQIKAKNVEGQFYVDVVTADSMPDYLAQRVGIFVDAVAEVAANSPQRFVTHQDHSYMEPPSTEQRP